MQSPLEIAMPWPDHGSVSVALGPWERPWAMVFLSQLHEAGQRAERLGVARKQRHVACLPCSVPGLEFSGEGSFYSVLGGVAVSCTLEGLSRLVFSGGQSDVEVSPVCRHFFYTSI